MAEIKVGEFVRIGRSSLTWEVVSLYSCDSHFGPRPAAKLKSGQSGRGRAEFLDNLTRHPHQKETA